MPIENRGKRENRLDLDPTLASDLYESSDITDLYCLTSILRA